MSKVEKSVSSKVKKPRKTNAKATPYDKTRGNKKSLPSTVVSDAPFDYHEFCLQLRSKARKISTEKKFQSAISSIAALFKKSTEENTQFNPWVTLSFLFANPSSNPTSSPLFFFSDQQTIYINMVMDTVEDLSIGSIYNTFLSQSSIMKYVKGFNGQSDWNWIVKSGVKEVKLDILHVPSNILFIQEVAPQLNTLSIGPNVTVDLEVLLGLCPNLDNLTIRFQQQTMYNSSSGIRLSRFMNQLIRSGRVLKCLCLEGLCGYSFDSLAIDQNQHVTVEKLEITQLCAFTTNYVIDSITRNFKADAFLVKAHHESTQSLNLAPRTSEDLEEICKNLMIFKTINGVMITDPMGYDLELIPRQEWIKTHRLWLRDNVKILSGGLRLSALKSDCENFCLASLCSTKSSASIKSSASTKSSASISFFNNSLFDRNLLNIIFGYVCY